MSALFQPLLAGDLPLANRIVMAPLTRARSGRSHIPNALMAEYYGQRASAGLIITEATMIAADGCAFTAEGGLFDDECVAGWRQVTTAVHDRGGQIMVQLWHPGRAAHSLLNDGVQPVSSGNQAIQGSRIQTPAGEQDYEVPRRLQETELPAILEQFRLASARAMQAGFDGVQLHGAHGYLLDQFLRDSCNDRDDGYGGSIEGRARLLLEAVDAAIAECGAGRVAVRISPLVPFNDIHDSQAQALVEFVAQALDTRGIAFLEMRHSNHADPAEQQIAQLARHRFHGALFVNGGYDQQSAEAAVVSAAADAVVFGKAFIANPDLVERMRRGAELSAVDFSTLYTPGAKGYTDYPTLDAS